MDNVLVQTNMWITQKVMGLGFNPAPLRLFAFLFVESYFDPLVAHFAFLDDTVSTLFMVRHISMEFTVAMDANHNKGE